MCRTQSLDCLQYWLFLHEHPAHATSWNEPCVLEVLQLTGVSRITADQCQLGQQAENGQPIMKQTGFMSNCADILDRLEKRCTGRRGLCSRPGGGTHQLCNGKTARRAAIFQRELCEEILIGLKEYLTRHRRMRGNEQLYTDGCGVMIDGDDDVQLHHRSGLHRLRSPADGLDDPAEMYFANGSELGSTGPGGCPPPADEAGAAETGVFDGILQVGRHDRYVDDLTGQPLPPELCKAARKTELDYFNDKDVWVLRKVSEALRRTGKPPITVRWVETNKGDDQCPKIRSRLVAREIRLKGEEAIFAPTPPLESLRMVLSHATTRFPGEPEKIWDGESPERQMIFFMDISRAYFNAKVDENYPV